MGLYTDRGYSLDEARNAMAAEIESWYGGAALDTFDCNVLGTPHEYECNESAQLRMLNGKVSNQPVSLTCGVIPADRDNNPIVWESKIHTATECGKVHTEYTKFVTSIDNLRVQYKAQLATCTTVAQIDALFSQVLGL